MAPVLVVGADALIARCAGASDDAQLCDECVAGERAEGGSNVPLGERTSRVRLCLGKSLIGPRILLLRSVVLSCGPSHGRPPVLATEPRRIVYPSGSGACWGKVRVVSTSSSSGSSPIAAQASRSSGIWVKPIATQVASGKADGKVSTHLRASPTVSWP